MKTKRKLISLDIFRDSDFCDGELNSSIKRKLIKTHNFNKVGIPSSLVCHQDSIKVAHWVSRIISDVQDMEIDPAFELTVNQLRFVFFLGINGKEMVKEILSIFPEDFNEIVFVSSNFSNRIHNSNYIDGKECASIASYLKILDPLGGGIYPLDYLVVLDKKMRIRSKIPIRMSSRYDAHEKFGIDFHELRSLIEEYFMTSTC